VSHTYSTTGARTVTLTASGPSATDTFTRTNYITATSQALVITAINLSGSNVLVTFTSQTGKVYRLEYINNLGTFNWQTAVDLIAGTGAPLQVSHHGGAVANSHFYRVHQLP
jgi:PKD repeat protein